MLRRVETAPCADWKSDVTSFGGNTEKEEKGKRGGVRWERGDGREEMGDEIFFFLIYVGFCRTKSFLVNVL